MTAAQLLKLSRPRFWMYLAGPFLLGYLAGQSAPRTLLTLGFWLPFLYFLVPANVFLYGINDLFDTDTDHLNPKKDAQEHRLAERQRGILIALLIAVGVLDVIFIAALPIPIWPLFALFLLLSAFYSAPPIRLKGRAFFNSYSNVLYVLPGFLGYFLTAQRLPPLLIMVGAACWAAGMHAYSAIPDIVPDQNAGIRTVAVALGERRALLFVLANWLIFALLSVGVLGTPALLMLIYPLIPLALYLRSEWSVARAYWWFPVVNALIGFLAFLYLTVFAR